MVVKHIILFVQNNSHCCGVYWSNIWEFQCTCHSSPECVCNLELKSFNAEVLHCIAWLYCVEYQVLFHLLHWLDLVWVSRVYQLADTVLSVLALMQWHAIQLFFTFHILKTSIILTQESAASFFFTGSSFTLNLYLYFDHIRETAIIFMFVFEFVRFMIMIIPSNNLIGNMFIICTVYR